MDKPTELEQAINKFRDYFKDDLIGHLSKKKPAFRVAVAGGYGLKVLIESKYNRFGAVKTSDLDLTISTHKSTMSPLEAYTHWMVKVMKFVHEQDEPRDYKIVAFDQDQQYVPIQDYKRHFIIVIYYKGQDFVDVAITDMELDPKSMDKEVSLKTGMPVKTLLAYLKDFLTIIYRANVRGVSDDVYAKRNPVVGAYYEKGLKDISRAKLICSIGTKKQYMKYCKIIQSITKEKLRSMSRYQRDEYFKILESLVPQKSK